MISLRLCSKSIVEQHIELQSLVYYVPSLAIPSISPSFFLGAGEFRTDINRMTQTPGNDTSGSPKATGPWTAIMSNWPTLKLILHLTVSWFSFLFLVFAKSIEEFLEQYIGSKTVLETSELCVILRVTGILDVTEDMDYAILN